MDNRLSRIYRGAIAGLSGALGGGYLGGLASRDMWSYFRENGITKDIFGADIDGSGTFASFALIGAGAISSSYLALELSERISNKWGQYRAKREKSSIDLYEQKPS